MFGIMLWALLLMTAIIAHLDGSADGRFAGEAGQLAAPREVEGQISRSADLYRHVPETDRVEARLAQLAVGTSVSVAGLSTNREWLFVSQGVGPFGWVRSSDVHLVGGSTGEMSTVLDGGLWLFSVTNWGDPSKLSHFVGWNSWQWDPEDSAIWYPRSRWDATGEGHGNLSRQVAADWNAGRVDYHLAGHVLAAPVGGAVLVRERYDRDAPHDNVHILDSNGAVHTIARQCSGYFTDSYRPFGGDAAWSPDGEFVVLKDRTGNVCEGGGATIYDRDGVVEPDLTDRHDPYRQAWYREPNFGDQVGVDHECRDTPPGVALSDRRNRCQWSPDRQWFATMPGAVDNPRLGELLIYAADGTLARRFLIVGWPCNTLQWSPDSQWLAYGGPSGCA